MTSPTTPEQPQTEAEQPHMQTITRDDTKHDVDYLLKSEAEDIIRALAAELAQARAEIENLHTVMMAAAVEIQEHWDAHCDAEGYGPANLMHRLERGIASQYGYDAKAFVCVTEQRDKAEAERDTLRAELEGLKAQQWQDINTAPDDMTECVAVRWINGDGQEISDLDYKEGGCWMNWHDRAEHVEIIGGHAVSYTPPYQHWMPLPAPPTGEVQS